MPIHLVRYALAPTAPARWGVVSAGLITPLEGSYETTAALIENGDADIRRAAERVGSVDAIDVASVSLLSPVTAPARVICQGANYRQHMVESGMDPDAKRFNMFFNKSDASIAPPVGRIVRPAHVKLLDYEVELALVMRRAVTGPVTVTPDRLHEFVFGLAVANDVSARDVQLPETQFFKGKSYRGFCPVGPYLALLDASDLPRLDRLELTLTVDGEVRQRDTTANLVYKPAETLTELSTFSYLSPGDVLLAGTPAGCALRVPPRLLRSFMQLILPEPRLWATFTKMQARRTEYLRPGQTVRARIASSDGAINLGEQRHVVDEASA